MPSTPWLTISLRVNTETLVQDCSYRPTVLYGSELWNNLSATDTQRLAVFQHSMCQKSQTLSRRTRSNICERLFGVYPISSEIDRRKLLFCGRFCLLNCQALPEKIFLTRLFSFFKNFTQRQLGIIPYILNLLPEYNLVEFLQQWLNGAFPTKQTWKTIVKRAFYQHRATLRNSRMICDPDILRLSIILQGTDPSSFCHFPSNCHEISLCKFI